MEKTRYFIHSLQKGLSILTTFSPQEPNLMLSELARANGMSLATTRRYLLTLEELGYLAKDPDSKNKK